MREKIGIIIPTTSNRTKYKDISQYIFFRNFLPTFLNTVSNNYNYNFYLGYDNDDNFFIKYKDNITEEFKKKTGENYSINLIEINNLRGRVGMIWSELAKNCSNEVDYIYQVGDDILFKDKNWDTYFVNILKYCDNYGCIGPYDSVTNSFLLTQSFVHKDYLKIFDTYFPKEIINWDIDLWLTFIFGSVSFQNYRVANHQIGQKYTPVNNKENYKVIRNRDLDKLYSFLEEKLPIKILKLREENKNKNKKLTVCIFTNDCDNIFFKRLINKIRWSSGKNREYIEIVAGNKIKEMLDLASGEFVVSLDEKSLLSDDFFFQIFNNMDEEIEMIQYKKILYSNDFIREKSLTNKQESVVKKDFLLVNKEPKKVKFIDLFLYHHCTNPQL